MAKLRSTDVNGNLFVSGQLKLTNPFLISTNSLITNLNADLLDGYHANDLIVRSTKCYDTSTSDTADGNWTVSIPGITELTEGLTIKIRLKRAGASTCKLNLNGLGAKTVYLRYGTKLTTHYAKESVLALTYTGDAVSSGTDRTGWIVENYYDRIDVNNLTVHSSKYPVKNTLYRYQICFINKDEQLIPTYHGGDNNVNTNKILTTESFIPEKGIFFYYTTATVQSGSYPTTETLYTNAAAIDLRFSFNTGQTLIAGSPVYLVVTPQSDGQVKLASTPIVQALPTTENSNYYIYLGQPYDNYRLSLVVFHPIFKWNKKTSSFTTDSVEASDSISSLNTSVTTLNSYFTNGIAKKATADASGNVITSTYVKKAGDTMTGGLSPATNKGASLGTSSLYWNNIYGTTLYENGTSLADKYASKTNLLEAYLTWGGRNLSNSYGPIDAAMVPALGANRLAFADAAGIEVEYSRDAGSSWSDYVLTNQMKTSIFSGPQVKLSTYIGNPGTKNPSTGIYDNASVNNRLRITLRTDLAKVYTVLNKFVILCSTNGSTGCKCIIEGLTKKNFDEGNDSWGIFANGADLGGWSGFNVINTSNITTYGNHESQYIKLRFTFYCTGDSGDMKTYGGLEIINIYGFGGFGWTTPSNMARWGQIYTYDSDQNVTFPGNIYSKTIQANGIYPRSLYSDLGSKSASWRNAYAKTFYEDGTELTNKYAPKSHTHTKSDVGLGNVDNTADADKSVKYATTAGSANSVTWTNVSNKPTTFPPDSHNHDDRYYTESEMDSKLNGKSDTTHNHDGRYLKWNGSSADTNNMGWGTLTATNGYTILSHASSSDGGDWGMVNKDGKIFMQLDGYYYQNEGLSRVLDTSDSSSFAAASHTHNYLSNVATVSGGNTANYPWRRIMSIPSTTSNWVDVVGTYYLSGNYHGGPYYLFRVVFRTNFSTNGALGNFQISVIATNSDPTNLAIASYSVAANNVTTSYSDIFVKVPSYPRMTLTRLSPKDIGTINYYNSNEGNDASSRTEAYTEINGSGTGYASSELHSLSAYTYVNKGELSSKVSYANSAGSVPWGSVTNKPSTFPPDSHTHSYLPLDGSSAMTGTITLPENHTSLKFRTPSDYETGTFYGTSGNEALTFYAKSAQTSFQFISGFVPGSTDSWKTIAPGLQIKNNKVIINKKLGDGESSDYNLEVNGFMYASNITTPGTLDLSTSSNGIQFCMARGGTPYFVTNIEAGSKDVTLGAKNGAEASVNVTYHNGSKGGGTWYIVATAHGSYCDTVSVGIESESTTGFKIWVRNVYAAASRTLHINWIAIKYH